MKELLLIFSCIIIISSKKNENSIQNLPIEDSSVAITKTNENSAEKFETPSQKQNNCSGRDEKGNYKNIVINRLRDTGKIPQFVEFNGNGNYVVQAYDTEYGLTFGGYVTINECGEVIDVQVNADPNNQ